MSIGVSPSDFITIPTFAWTVYKACKESSDDFKHISTEVASLHIVLKETRDSLSEHTLSRDQETRLDTLGRACYDVLKDLEDLLKKYESLGTQSQRTWDRMRWGLEPISDLRDRLISNTTLLTAFNSSLLTTSVVGIEKKLNKLIDEVRTGKREGSVISTHSIESLSVDDKDAWRQLRRELEDIGISAALLNQHREFIVNWFREAVAAHSLEESVCEQPVEQSLPWGSAQLQTLPFEVLPSRKRITEAVSIRRPSGLSRQSTDEQPHSKSKKPSRLRGSYLVFKLFQSNAELLSAANVGDIKRTSELLAFGADVNYQNEQSWTALHTAARYGPEVMVELLLNKGANVNARDNHGTTPLHQAALKGFETVAQFLIEHGADYGMKDNVGWTALHSATSAGHKAVAQLLVEYGANLEAKDNDGRTALHWAALKGREAVAQMLVEEGANHKAEDNDGRTALHWANSFGHESLVRLLTSL